MKKLFKILLIPRKIFNHLWNYVFLVFLSNSKIHEFPKINGRIIVKGKGELILGKSLKINSNATTNPVGLGDKMMFYVGPKGIIKVGNNVGITTTLLYSRDKIIIEDNVLIGGGCQLLDSDFHSLDYYERVHNGDKKAKSAPIIIKEGAFIGTRTIILKGVTVGTHSIIAAGSVVVKSIPAGEIWGGNPAQFIKKCSL